MAKDIQATTRLIERCGAGDQEAMEQLLSEVEKYSHYLFLKSLRSPQDAQDATQDVLIAVYTKLDTLQNPDAFWGWVRQMVFNRCKNAINRAPRESQIPEDEEGNSLLDDLESLDRQSVPETVLDDAETRRMILELVDALPDAQRMTVLYYYYDELPVKDIAKLMETTEGTVKSRLNYARKAIKEGVEEHERKGVKLYGVSPLVLLPLLLRGEADALGSGAVTAGVMAAGSTGAVGAVAAGSAAKAGLGLGVKLAVGALAAAVAAGGVAYVATRPGESEAPSASEIAVLEPGQATRPGGESVSATEELTKEQQIAQAMLQEMDELSGENLWYAKLIDISNDGIEDLVLFYGPDEKNDHHFSAWFWDASERQLLRFRYNEPVDERDGGPLFDSVGFYQRSGSPYLYVGSSRFFPQETSEDGSRTIMASQIHDFTALDYIDRKYRHVYLEHASASDAYGESHIYSAGDETTGYSYSPASREEYEARLSQFALVEEIITTRSGIANKAYTVEEVRIELTRRLNQNT